jgi:hypothetical protein
MCVHFKLFEALFFWGGVTGHLLPFLKEKKLSCHWLVTAVMDYFVSIQLRPWFF